MSSFETLLPPPIRSRYDSDEINSNRTETPFYRKLHLGHANFFLNSIVLIMLVIISIEITPLINDANMLVHDGSKTLKDIDLIIPDVSNTLDDMRVVMPNVKNTLDDMDIIIPQIKHTLNDVTIIMPEIKDILRMVKRLCQFENFTTPYGFLCD